MTTWLIGGIAILVLLASLAGFVAVHDHGIATAQQAKDEAAISAADNNTAICKQANVELQASVDVIEKDRVKQNNAVLEWQKNAKDMIELAQYWRGKYQSTQVQLVASQQDAHRKGQRPPEQTQTCQQVLDEITADDKVWLPEREARMRDILGLPAAPPGLKVGK